MLGVSCLGHQKEAVREQCKDDPATLDCRMVLFAALYGKRRRSGDGPMSQALQDAILVRLQAPLNLADKDSLLLGCLLSAQWVQQQV